MLNKEMTEKPHPLGLAGKLAKTFLINKELNVLAMAIIFAWGIGSFIFMPKQYNPEITAPAFIITTDFPGADSRRTYDLITRPMEDKLREIPELDEISSKTFDGGRSIVMARFNIGADLEDAKITLTQKLSDNMHLKPSGAADPAVVSVDPDDVPILHIAISSDQLSPSSLRALAVDLAQELKTTKGAGKIELKGGQTNNLQITLDSASLEAHAVTVSEVLNSLKATAGIYSAQSLSADSTTIPLQIWADILSPEEAGRIIVKGGRIPVELADVAHISYRPDEISSYVRLNGKESTLAEPTAYIAISKLKGTNITAVADALKERLELLREDPRFADASIRVLKDDGEMTREQITTLTEHLILSIAIVTAVLMLFLGLRNALIVSVAVPLTLLASFGIGFLLDQTINRITLFALILSLGLLVDDAIVVIENIHRFLQKKSPKSKDELIVEAVDEVGMGVAMSTFTVLLAFIPMAFVTGMMGPYMAPIPFFVSVTLLVSLLIAFTINPFLTGVFTGKSHAAKEKDNVFIRGIRRLEEKYVSLLGKLIGNRKKRNALLGILLGLFLVSLALPALRLVQFRMLPKADKEQFYVQLDMPRGTDIGRTEQISARIEQDTLAHREVTSVESFIGEGPVVDFNGLFQGSFLRSAQNQSTFKVNLTHKSTRKETSEKLALSLRETLQKNLADQPDALVRIVEDPPGPPVMSTVFFKVQGPIDAVREQMARDLASLLAQTKGVTDIDTSAAERGLEKSYRIDTAKAQRLGVNPTQAAEVLQASLAGAKVGLYRSSPESPMKEPQFLSLRLEKSARDSVSDLEHILLSGSSGPVALSELLTEEELSSAPLIEADERARTTYVSAEMADRSVMYAILDILPKLRAYEAPVTGGALSSWNPLALHYGRGANTYSVLIDGEWKLTLEIFRDLGIAMGVALLLIYFVLVAQTKSLKVPLLIMGTIPLALIGVLWGFAVLGITKGTYFNATSMIGVIALAGIVVKNAIIYLAYLDEMKKKGVEISKALLRAGRTRLLPILLTSLTAILGSLTIISDPVWEGLAWAIIFGLSVSTALTLVVFPLLYLIFEGKNWKNRT